MPDPKEWTSDPAHGRKLNGQTLTPSTATAIKYGSACGSAHTLAEAVFVTTLSIARLKGAFHVIISYLRVLINGL